MKTKLVFQVIFLLRVHIPYTNPGGLLYKKNGGVCWEFWNERNKEEQDPFLWAWAEF